MKEILKRLELTYKGEPGDPRYPCNLAAIENELQTIDGFMEKLQRNLQQLNIPFRTVNIFEEAVEKQAFPLGETGNTYKRLMDFIESETSRERICYLIYNIDSLLTTWSKISVKRFFERFLSDDKIRTPVLLISGLISSLELPQDKGKIFNLLEEGIL